NLSCLLFTYFFSFFSPFLLFTHTSPTVFYTLSLHDALPICRALCQQSHLARGNHRQLLPGLQRHFELRPPQRRRGGGRSSKWRRSEEHTSELQSLAYLVCRLLLEKKKRKQTQDSPKIRER